MKLLFVCFELRAQFLNLPEFTFLGLGAQLQLPPFHFNHLVFRQSQLLAPVSKAIFAICKSPKQAHSMSKRNSKEGASVFPSVRVLNLKRCFTFYSAMDIPNHQGEDCHPSAAEGTS